MTIPPKATNRFGVIPIKLPMYFSQLEQKSLKIYIKTQKTPNSQSHPEKETLIHEELEESSSLTSDYTIKLQ